MVIIVFLIKMEIIQKHMGATNQGTGVLECFGPYSRQNHVVFPG
jgi:hypothetical protein